MQQPYLSPWPTTDKEIDKQIIIIYFKDRITIEHKFY